MKLVVLMSFFDEDPEWLKRSVLSLAPLPVTDLVVLDGPYHGYPSEGDSSPDSNYEALDQACDQLGIYLRYHSEGRMSEVDKRARLFELGEKFTTEDDWFMILDADEELELIDGPFTLEGNVGEITLYEPDTGETMYIRIFFRALRGLTVEGNHHTYVAGDKVLWGLHGHETEAAHDTNLIFSHHTHGRHPDRKGAADEYYRVREEQGLEKFRCHWCGEWTTIHKLPWDWRYVGNDLRAAFVATCDECLPLAEELSKIQHYEVTGENTTFLSLSQVL